MENLPTLVVLEKLGEYLIPYHEEPLLYQIPVNMIITLMIIKQ